MVAAAALPWTRQCCPHSRRCTFPAPTAPTALLSPSTLNRPFGGYTLSIYSYKMQILDLFPRVGRGATAQGGGTARGCSARPPPRGFRAKERTSAGARSCPPRLGKSAPPAQEATSLRAPRSPSNAHHGLRHHPVPPRPRVTTASPSPCPCLARRRAAEIRFKITALVHLPGTEL